MVFSNTKTTTKEKVLGRLKCVRLVNQVLNLHKGTTIDQFRVCFNLCRDSGPTIDNWIDFAIKKKVQRLILDLSRGRLLNHGDDNLYPFPSQFIDFSNLKFLKALHLNFVDVTGQLVETFLLECPFLEYLHVENTLCLQNLRVCGCASLKLKYLEIIRCPNLEHLVISAVNLISFSYGGPEISILYENVPRLAMLSFRGAYCASIILNFSLLSSFTSHIETLALDLRCYEVYVDFPLKFRTLSSLKQLELIVCANDDYSLLPCMSLIKACPLLYKISLQFSWLEPCMQRRVWKGPRCQLKCLKVVELLGFAGRTTDVELAMCLVKNASSLEMITFDTRDEALVSPTLTFMKYDKVAAREVARQLGRKLPPQTGLVIL